MGSVFGKAAKSTNTSEASSSNQAFPFLQGALSPFIGQAQQAGGQMANMLGLNGAQAQSGAFDAWKGSTGYQAGLDQGLDAVTGTAASKGLLNSGSALKALTQFGQDYASSKYGDYMTQLQNLINPGMQAAGTIAGAGQVSKSTSSGVSKGPTQGFGSVVGSVLGK